MKGYGNRLSEGKNEKELLKRILNLNSEHVIDYQQRNSGNSNSKVITLQIIIM